MTGRPLPNRVREVRKARGLTTRQLAASVGVDQSHVSQVERGVRGVSDSVKLRIAQALGVGVTDLFFVDFQEPDVENPSAALCEAAS